MNWYRDYGQWFLEAVNNNGVKEIAAAIKLNSHYFSFRIYEFASFSYLARGRRSRRKMSLEQMKDYVEGLARLKGWT